MGNNALPKEIVERFKGKVIAITGYEMDQVRYYSSFSFVLIKTTTIIIMITHVQVMVSPVGQPGVNSSADVSVPINWAYNHHYMLWMTGQNSEMKYVKPEPGDVSAHGAPLKWKAVDKPSAALRDDPSIPVSQLFSEGNGGESRKSFHGYPNGYAQLIESPNLWHITPMQIDTRNRDCGVKPEDVKNCTTFTPGPEPKQARYGRGMPENPIYSGLLECPGSSRFGGDPIFYGEDTKTRQIDVSYEMIPFGVCETQVKDAASCYEAAASFNIASLKNETVSDSSKPKCFVLTGSDGTASVIFNTNYSQQQECSRESVHVGVAKTNVNVVMNIHVDEDKDNVTIVLSGPSSGWFGVGFNAQKMADMPYTIVVNSTGVIEQKIGTCGSEADHCPGTLLQNQVKLVSNEVQGNTRTVVVTRSIAGVTSDHYTFNMSSSTQIPFIAAVGSSQTFAYVVCVCVCVRGCFFFSLSLSLSL